MLRLICSRCVLAALSKTSYADARDNELICFAVHFCAGGELRKVASAYQEPEGGGGCDTAVSSHTACHP